MAKLEEQEIWKWEKSYDNPDVLDGTSWEIEIDLGDKRIRSSGMNSYPGIENEGQEAFVEATAEYNAFLAALKNLSGKRIR